MNIITKEIDINLIQLNEGQITGLPKNPRFIKSEKYEKLKKSIIDNPEMLLIRECIVVAYDNKFVLIGGNMRYRALQELKHKTITCKVLPENTPIENLKAILIKDNESFGQWDFEELANGDWDLVELDTWGVDLPQDLFQGLEEPEQEEQEIKNSVDYNKKYQIVVDLISEREQEELFNNLSNQGYTCRVLTL